ncbi:MAG TPA: hypothetical protein VFG15_30665 [Amycolatopsis sp.]|nr:hypothetical protein [Amycolatopsis sp.]
MGVRVHAHWVFVADGADISGDGLSQAIAEGHAAVRAAPHSAGIGTPDRPTHGEALSMVLKDLRTEQLV